MSEPRLARRATARVVARLSVPPPLTIRQDMHDVRLAGPRDRTILFERVTLERVDFAGSRFYHFAAVGSRFVDCDFSKVRFDHALGFDASDRCEFVDCRFDGADLRQMVDPSTNRFVRCTFRQSRIKGWQSWCAEFVDCLFACRVESCVFSGRPFECRANIARTTNEFRGNDFSHGEIGGTDFRNGIDLDAQRWPDAPGYRRFDRWVERYARARAEVESWPPSKERSKALRLLEAHSPVIYGNQASVLFTPDTMGTYGQALQDLLITILDSA